MTGANTCDECWENGPKSMTYTGSQKIKSSIEIVLAYVAEDIFRLCADLLVYTQDNNEEPKRHDYGDCGR
jgi:hypothetical protein